VDSCLVGTCRDGSDFSGLVKGSVPCERQSGSCSATSRSTTGTKGLLEVERVSKSRRRSEAVEGLTPLWAASPTDFCCSGSSPKDHSGWSAIPSKLLTKRRENESGRIAILPLFYHMSKNPAVDVLEKAEQEIRILIGKSAAAGEYESVVRLGGIARRLAEMVTELRSVCSGSGESRVDSIGGAGVKGLIAVKRSGTRVARQSAGAEGYPKFERSKDQLVKVGWSKKERCEYLHRAPRAVLDVVVRQAEKLGAADRVFTADELLPQCCGEDGNEFPRYQTYLCLAWLRSIGALDQHGRDGYSATMSNITEAANGSWSALPSSFR
jgi:hypothetical protein